MPCRRRQPGRLHDVPPQQMLIPPPCLGPPRVLSPLGGILLIMVVCPLCHCHCSCCCIALRSNSIIAPVLPLLMHIAVRHCNAIQVFPPPIWRRPLFLFDWSIPLHPRSCVVIDRCCPWEAWIDLLLLPLTTMANDVPSLPIPSPSSHAVVSCPSAAISGASTLLVSLGTSSTRLLHYSPMTGC